MSYARMGAALLAIAALVGPGHLSAAPRNLKVKDVDTGIIADLRLDQVLTFRVRGKVKKKHLGFDVFRITDPSGQNPRGTFVHGRPLFDPLSGTVVVVDPDQIGMPLIKKVEKKGRIDLIPRSQRYDLGAVSSFSGNRRVLIDRSRKARKRVTFVPDVPELSDLSDTAYRPGELLFVASKGKRGLKETFLTVAASDAHLFIGVASEGRPRIVNSDPANAGVLSGPNQQIRLRFSHPLDPRTVGGQQSIFLHLASVAGRPGIPVSTVLRQTALGTVELTVTPEQPLPGNEYFELSITPDLTDLLGNPIAAGFTLWFSTGDSTAVPEAVSESFDTNDREDAGATDADWNGAAAGALVAGPGTTTARSLWFDSRIVTPNYGTPTVDLAGGGGTIDIFVQGAREDVLKPGAQPVDPEADPDRLETTDWVRLAMVDVLDNYQYLRFRVEFAGGDPLPVVKSIEIPVSATRD